jgi:hypothetical protein
VGTNLERIKNTDKGYEVSYETSNPIHKLVHTIFSDEEVVVLTGDTVLVKIVPMKIPENCLSFIDSYVRHPLGNTLMLIEDPQKKIEVPRMAMRVAFQGIADGRIEKGDVIGVVDFIHAEVFKIETEEFERIRDRLKKVKEMTI